MAREPDQAIRCGVVIWWVSVAAGVGLALTALLIVAGVMMWRRVTSADRQLIKRILKLPVKSKFRLAGGLLREPRIPVLVRMIPAGLVLYLAMPIDLIPDFIPVLGQIDDIAIVVVGVGLLLRFAPRDVVENRIAVLEETARQRLQTRA